MADWDAIANDLLRTVLSVDTDVRFRSILLRQQCERLHNIYNHMSALETARFEEQSVRQAETLAVKQSIQEAVLRARQIRTEIAASDESGRDSSKEPLQPEDPLQSILAIAKATQMAQQRSEQVEHLPEVAPRARLKYPVKLKALEMQLNEMQLKEQEASIRFAFCCRTSEYLSLSYSRRELAMKQQEKRKLNGKTDVPAARIQTSFPLQVISLQHGYQRLMEFMLTKLKIKSLEFEQVAKTPTLSSVFPIYHRIKQAKRMFRLLNSETRALLKRLPTSVPRLSQTAVAYRDTTLARICRKVPHVNVGIIDNGPLHDLAPQLHVDKELLRKLQAAWAAVTPSHIKDPSVNLFSTAVREIVLTELSNAVLWTFKTYFSETAEQPNAVQVEAIMRLVRLVDSVALSRGRAYRSIVALH